MPFFMRVMSGLCLLAKRPALWAGRFSSNFRNWCQDRVGDYIPLQVWWLDRQKKLFEDLNLFVLA